MARKSCTAASSAALLALAVCTPQAMEPAGAGHAKAAAISIRDAAGKTVASVSLVQETGGVRIMVKALDIAPGKHGVHVHQTGICDAPGFASAGGHWNPAGHEHGFDNARGAHAGDMPNLDIAPDGTGALDYVLEGATLAALHDADGAALVIHAGADDQRSDPSGNSGARLACGVL